MITTEMMEAAGCRIVGLLGIWFAYDLRRKAVAVNYGGTGWHIFDLHNYHPRFRVKAKKGTE